MATDKEREQARLQQQAMPLMDHLREMRTRLIRTGMAVAAGVVLCFFFAPDIWAFLVAPMNDALRANDAGTMAILAPLEVSHSLPQLIFCSPTRSHSVPRRETAVIRKTGQGG